MLRPVCPDCGSGDVRLSRARSHGEAIAEWFGVFHLRCRVCHRRFCLRTWSWRYWVAAHCPQCYRTELTQWRETRYRPGWVDRLCLRMGGKPLRCDACRKNFVTFRRWKPARAAGTRDETKK